MKTNISSPLISKMAIRSSGRSSFEAALKESFYQYWNLPRGTASSRGRANFVKQFAIDCARIMSRAYQYPYPLPKQFTDVSKKEINDDRQISKRGKAPPG